jgi:hypothetical protein
LCRRSPAPSAVSSYSPELSVLVSRVAADLQDLNARLLPGKVGIARAEHLVESLEGHQRVIAAQERGFFDDLIIPLDGITRGGWKLVKTVTAFTISHSITLSAATLGYVHVPQRPVEAVIALSIVFVATEIVRMRRGITGITASAPWVVALTFGLMHGLGFAGGLSEAGLPAGHIPTALLFFSLGVESGHFLFIGVVLSSIALLARIRIPFPRWTELVPPYAIGTIAMFWVIQRITAF